MRIATWNINSIRQRLEHLLTYLKNISPDVLCLQEIKCMEAHFPFEEIASAGYNICVSGQKGFNGVAILSKAPIEEVQRNLPGDPADIQARYLEVLIPHGERVIRLLSIYTPNGNPAFTSSGDLSEKYLYKLAWLDRLIEHARLLLTYEEPCVIAGDYNIIPGPRDVWDPAVWLDDALYLPEVRARFQRLLHLGFTHAVRATTDEANIYSFWDYQAGSWRKNFGILIDHILLSPQAADLLESASIDRDMRDLDKPSDHVPVRVDLKG